jgi:hypothetical protein
LRVDRDSLETTSGADAGVVNQNLNRPSLAHRFNTPSRINRVYEITDHETNIDAQSFQIIAGLHRPLLVDINTRYRIAGTSEPFRQGSPDPVGRTRDHAAQA